MHRLAAGAARILRVKITLAVGPMAFARRELVLDTRHATPPPMTWPPCEVLPDVHKTMEMRHVCDREKIISTDFGGTLRTRVLYFADGHRALIIRIRKL